MSYLKVKNRAESTLASGITDVATSLSVAAGEGANFPADNFMITIEDEILFCSSRSTDTLTVVREQEGTTGVAHDADVAVELRITAGVIQNLERGCGQINVETLSAAKTLTPGTDEMYQFLDPDGTGRTITLDTASASAGDRFIIRNNSDSISSVASLSVKQGATTLDWIYTGTIRAYIFDGTNWRAATLGSGEDGVYTDVIALGKQSRSFSGGVSIGYKANNVLRSVAIGYEAAAGTDGVAIGYDADARGSGIAIGRSADNNTRPSSIALGVYSKCNRAGEMSVNINPADTDQENNYITIGFEKLVANNTPVALSLGGQSTSYRLVINASSVLAFTGIVTARDNTSGDCAAYKIEGAIKRDAAGNTAMLAAATVTVIHEDDASWDVGVTADDTNEALVITVTSDATNLVQWVARLDGVETHF